MPRLPGARLDVPAAPGFDKTKVSASSGLPEVIEAAGDDFNRAAITGLKVADVLQQQEDAIRLLHANDRINLRLQEVDAKPFDPSDPDAYEARRKEINDIFSAEESAWKGGNAGKLRLQANMADRRTEAFAQVFGRRLVANKELAERHLAQAGTNFSNNVYANPGAYEQTRNDAATFFDNDLAPTFGNPQVAATKRQEFLGTIDFSAADALIENGDTAGARTLLGKIDTISPEQRRILTRKAQQYENAAAGDREWRMGPDGVMYTPNGDISIPPPEVQQYLQGLKQAGQPSVSVSVDTKGRGKFAERRSEHLADDMRAYQTRATESADVAERAENIHVLLSNQPTGTWSADMKAAFQRQLGLNEDQTATREAAEAASFQLVLDQAKRVAPVTGPDIELLRQMTPGTAQTPKGRETLIYLAKRTAQYNAVMGRFVATVGDHVEAGEMSEGTARRAIAAKERELQKGMRESFSPPR